MTMPTRAGVRGRLARTRMRIERGALAAVPRTGRPRGRILCYHAVGTPLWGVNDVSPHRFRSQLEAALAAGYRFVPAAEVAADPGGDGQRLAVTFDDGLRSVAANAAPVLAALGIPWTLFVVSDWADGRHERNELLLGWRELAALAEQGVSIGSHSCTHPDFGRLGAPATLDELRRSREVIEDRLGLAVREFAIPFGQRRNWTELASRAAADVGYRTVYAQAEQTRPAGTVARTFVTRYDGPFIFSAALRGAFDRWEEWY